MHSVSVTIMSHRNVSVVVYNLMIANWRRCRLRRMNGHLVVVEITLAVLNLLQQLQIFLIMILKILTIFQFLFIMQGMRSALD